MNLIILSKNYPNNYSTQLGIFVEEQVNAMKAKIDGNITVISPVPWSPRLFWLRNKWRDYGIVEKENIRNGIRIYHPRYFVIPGKFFFPLQGFMMFISIRSLVKDIIKGGNSCNILHSHTILPDGLAGNLIKRKLKIPHICTIHGSDINYYPFQTRLTFFLTKYSLINCDYIVTVSAQLKEIVHSIANGLTNISTIYNGANHEAFRIIPREKAKEGLGLNDQSKIIIFVGNLIPIKGVKYLLDAFNLLLKEDKRDDVKLFVIGDGSERERLIELTKKLQIDDKVLFLGRRPHEEIPLWLNISDILILPSINEGFPTIIPEAMRCGVPVIASNVGGIPEIVVHGTTGFLVTSENSSQIKDYMKLLLDNSLLRNQMAENAVFRAKEYTWENNALSYIKIFTLFVNNQLLN